jgi:hypothetical protein
VTLFPVDSDSAIQEEIFAVIQSPRNNRKRFPEGCVTPVASEDQARSQALGQPGKCKAAVVYGPSYSSEGMRVFHLVRWLD